MKKNIVIPDVKMPKINAHQHKQSCVIVDVQLQQQLVAMNRNKCLDAFTELLTKPARQLMRELRRVSRMTKNVMRRIRYKAFLVYESKVCMIENQKKRLQYKYFYTDQ